MVSNNTFYLQTLCCYTDSEVLNFKQDEAVRADIRKHMRMHMGFVGKATAVETVIADVFNQTGYDLANISTIRETNFGVKRTAKQWDGYFMKMGIDPLRLDNVELLPACVVPKFAASMALHLRATLGRMGYSEANAALAEREYLRVARGNGVRHVDVAGHQQFVMNAYFGEHVLDHIALTRSRLPKWMKWAYGVDSIPKAVSAC